MGVTKYWSRRYYRTCTQDIKNIFTEYFVILYALKSLIKCFNRSTCPLLIWHHKSNYFNCLLLFVVVICCFCLLLFVVVVVVCCCCCYLLLFVVLSPAREYFAHKETSPFRGDLGKCSALKTCLQGGSFIYILSLMLWLETSVFGCPSQWIVT